MVDSTVTLFCRFFSKFDLVLSCQLWVLSAPLNILNRNEMDLFDHSLHLNLMDPDIDRKMALTSLQG